MSSARKDIRSRMGYAKYANLTDVLSVIQISPNVIYACMVRHLMKQKVDAELVILLQKQWQTVHCVKLKPQAQNA